MSTPEGFAFRQQGDHVVITHHSRVATTLRGRAAERFLSRVVVADDGTAQHLMARATGNYRRGNERG